MTLSNRRAEHLEVVPSAAEAVSGATIILGAYTPVLSSRLLRASTCLVLGRVSSLDAFSSYPLQRGCPAMPCRTTGKLVAASPRSSRTKGPFPSGTKRSQHIATILSHDGLNPSHDPF